jgi:hypothetical protein
MMIVNMYPLEAVRSEGIRQMMCDWNGSFVPPGHLLVHTMV